ncbi:hypothetical protein UPYG_G00303340 [Umbra pygmaea]|uniref:Niban 1/2/3 domain-containing protein n=1 Tax=Umbra pygmaea TaxID=75934 RepID=A0ABD0WB54_UMBPY
MGASSCSLLDETKSNYIRGRAEAELNNFSPHYRRQYSLSFCSELQSDVEQHKDGSTQLLKQKDPPRPEEVLYQDSVLYYDETRKWKERFVVFRANHSLECHDNEESFTKGVPARLSIEPTGGIVVTSEETYSALVDKAFPDPNGLKEELSPPMVQVSAGQFPVYLRLPYRPDAYFSFPQESRQVAFISALKGSIRHQNHDRLSRSACESQAFLKAIHFYRQEKGHYESWDMLVGSEEQVLANLVMEELLPSLQTELLPRLKGKKLEKKRVWFTTIAAAYNLVKDQLREGLGTLKKQCRDTTRSQEALIRSDMDQIASCKAFLQTKLQGSVSDLAVKFCSENVAPYLASILEELMSPVSRGFQGVRTLLEREMNALCLGFPEGAGQEGLNQALGEMRQASLDACYQEVEVLKEQLQELRHRFKFSNSVRLVHRTQIDMQQVRTAKLTSAMEKSKLRVLKQYDYDSSTVRKSIFQEALVDITLPAIRRSLAPACKPDLQKFDQYIFADYTNFIQVENVYEDILQNILTNEVTKVVKEAASVRKNNLMVDISDLQSLSQSSLADSRTPPLSAPSSPATTANAGPSRQAERESGTVQEKSQAADLAATVNVITSQREDSSVQDVGPDPILSCPTDVPLTDLDNPSPEDKPDVTLVALETQAAPRPAPNTPDPTHVVDDKSHPFEVTDKFTASPPGGTVEEPVTFTDTAKEAPKGDSLTVSLEALSVVGVIVPEATVPPSGQSQRHITDRAVYLNPPAGVKEDAEEERLCAETGDTEEHPIITAIETVESDSFHSDTPSQMEASGTVQASSPNEARDSETASQTGLHPGSNNHPGDSEDREAVSSVSGVMGAESQGVLPACNTPVPPPEGGITAQTGTVEAVIEEGDKGEDLGQHTNTDMEEEEEGACPLDSVKAIRDLVVEVIEVEELVQRCPSADRSPPSLET